MTVTAVLLESCAVTLAGPLSGVAIGNCRRSIGPDPGGLSRARTQALALRAMAVAAVFAVASLVADLLASHHAVTLAPHVMLWNACFAACALGIACGTAFADPLDAAACSLAITTVASFGVIGLGPLLTALPAAVVDAALALSPVSATASAAGLDLFRSEPFYQVSPLAHIHLTSPAWTTGASAHAVFAVACLASAGSLRHNVGRPIRTNEPQPERIMT
jgi:hypothetical protein